MVRSKPRSPRPRRPVLWLLCGALLLTVAVADWTAAGLLASGAVALGFLLRRRSPGRARAALAVLVVASTGVGALAALAVPRYRATADPLVLPTGAASGSASVPADQLRHASRFDLTGFVVADDDGAAHAVDRDVDRLSTLAATGVYLTSDGGGLTGSDVRDALGRAHAHQVRGELVVSNYAAELNSFDADRVHRMLRQPASSEAVARALATRVEAEGWDGLVLDLEQVPPQDRAAYAAFARRERVLLGERRLVVAVPAYDDPDDPDRAAYDLPALARACDEVVLMAYDEHDPTTGPGPVAGLPWVREVLALARREVPAGRLVLGVPAYAYAWPAHKAALDDLSVADALRLSAGPGWHRQFDPRQLEWHAWSDRGDQAWWSDGRSVAVRVALARSAGLRGAALWRLGGGDALTPATTGPVEHALIHPLSRGLRTVRARGVVALTFDDGPDPTWTPRVLAVLRREQVPATFFDVGTMAQAHPELVRQEVADGDVVANHTFSHLDAARVPRWREWLEIESDQWVLTGITGRTPALFRSPYGGNDIAVANGHRGADPHMPAALGLHEVDWTVDPEDWRRPGVGAIVDRAVDGASDTTVLLLHDAGGDRAQTVAALPRIIDRLKAEGYVFTTVDGVDAAVDSPYEHRQGSAVLRGLLLIAGFRLYESGRRVALWLVVSLGVLGLLRLVACLPLAVLHARRTRPGRTAGARPRDSGPRTGTSTTSGTSGTSDPVLPAVSVLVPAHDEAAVIAASLRSLAGSAVRPLAVHVCENGSTDGTADVARRAADALRSDGLVVHVHQLGPVGKAGALTEGAKRAEGEVVVVLDADTQLAPDALAALLEPFADPRVGAVAGNVRVGNHRGLTTWLQDLEYVVALNLDRRAQAVVNAITVVPGAAGAFRRSAVLDLGGWPGDTLVEDADLTVGLLAAGWQVRYAPHAVALTEAPQGPRDVLRQRRRWAYGTVQVAAKHAGALLRGGSGHVGWLVLPWLVLSQVLLPAAGPAVELFAGYQCLVGHWQLAATATGLALAADLVVAAVALRLDRRPARLLLLVPLARLLWRPLLLLAVLGSTRHWVRGRPVGWRRVRRHGSVLLPSSAGRVVPG